MASRDERIILDEADLRAVLDGVGFAPSCVNLDWRWETCAVTTAGGAPGPGDGWLVRTSFVRPDTETGEVRRGYGRWELVPRGATESAVVKTCWLLAELIVRHELMEAFHYRGVRIFDPHHSVEELSLPRRVRDGDIEVVRARR